jgi:hypothetical protein
VDKVKAFGDTGDTFEHFVSLALRVDPQSKPHIGRAPIRKECIQARGLDPHDTRGNRPLIVASSV